MWKYQSEGLFDWEMSYDFSSLLACNSEGRDFLLRNDGSKVKLSSLRENKFVGLYFSVLWDEQPDLYMLKQLYRKNKGEFEVVYISSDEDEDSFKAYFSKMPWLAIPFSDSTLWIRYRLIEFFGVEWPHDLYILGGNGKVLNTGPLEDLSKYGLEAYPFTNERRAFLFQNGVTTASTFRLKHLLVSQSLISNDRPQVPLSELEGKTVGLYICDISNHEASTEVLKGFYGKLKEKGVEDFEIVFVPSNADYGDQEAFTRAFQSMPWLALPFTDDDTSSHRILAHFQSQSTPVGLQIFDVDGHWWQCHSGFAQVERLRIQDYPFTQEFLNSSPSENGVKEESQAFESLLASFDQEFAITNETIEEQTRDFF